MESLIMKVCKRSTIIEILNRKPVFPTLSHLWQSNSYFPENVLKSGDTGKERTDFYLLVNRYDFEKCQTVNFEQTLEVGIFLTS